MGCDYQGLVKKRTLKTDFLNVKVDFQCCLYLTEYGLFQANETILHDYVWRGPDFVNLNSVISCQHWNHEPILSLLSSSLGLFLTSPSSLSISSFWNEGQSPEAQCHLLVQRWGHAYCTEICPSFIILNFILHTYLTMQWAYKYSWNGCFWPQFLKSLISAKIFQFHYKMSLLFALHCEDFWMCMWFPLKLVCFYGVKY